MIFRLLSTLIVLNLIGGGARAAALDVPPIPPPDAPSSILGVKSPDTRPIHWTAYYITPAAMSSEGKGKKVKYTDLAGETKTIWVTKECYDQAEIEAAAVGADKNGVEHFAYRLGPGVWKELPQGCAGMGNKVNALVPLDHVAAEQSKFPDGSMIYVPMAVGLKLGDADPSDGYFWVSDVGSAIKGNHFDLFVGKESIYKDFISRDKKPTYPTTIYRLPAPPKGFDPRTDDGLAAILKSEGLITEEITPEDKYKGARRARRLPAVEEGYPDCGVWKSPGRHHALVSHPKRARGRREADC